MTTLTFPESGDDWSDAVNNALRRGEFNNDPGSPLFWAFHDFQASEIEGEEIVADWFHQRNLLKYLRIPRTEDTES